MVSVNKLYEFLIFQLLNFYWVQEVSAVSELTQDFEIDLYINEFWEDPALVFDYMNPCKNNISFDDKVLQKLWIPNTCFINSKNAAIHESPFKNVFLMVLGLYRYLNLY